MPKVSPNPPSPHLGVVAKLPLGNSCDVDEKLKLLDRVGRPTLNASRLLICN